MAKTIKPSDLADRVVAAGLGKQAGLKLLGAAVTGLSKNDRLSRSTKNTLKQLRSSIADAEKDARKQARKGSAKRARRQLVADFQATAKESSRNAVEQAKKSSAKASKQAKKSSTKATKQAKKSQAKATKVAKRTRKDLVNH